MMDDIIYFSREPKRNKIIRVCCDECGKEVHGQAALMQHKNRRHGTKFTYNEIYNTLDRERYGLPETN